MDIHMDEQASRNDGLRNIRTHYETLLTPAESSLTPPPAIHKTYKRRYVGLVELILLNMMWLTYAPVANTSAVYFNTTASAINWLVVGFFFAFVLSSPLAYWMLNKHGPTTSIGVAAILLTLGNWIRYGSTKASSPSYAGVFVGQVIIGFSQPFVLASPTKYSEIWFSPKGRVMATAIATLANPFGGAIGSLVNPFLVVNPPDIVLMTFCIAVITSIVSVPIFCIPDRPPFPVAQSSVIRRPPVSRQIKLLASNTTFWLVYIPFTTLVGFFNSFSTLLTQFLTPYGLREDEAGIAGAILIISGIVTAIVTAPLVDRYKRYLLVIKTLVPILAISYLIFIWAPPTGGIVFPYVVCAILGATGLALVPVVLEWLCEVTYPVEPELTSVFSWAGGQLMGAIFIIASEALEAGPSGSPPKNMQRALIFQAVIAISVVPCVLLLGAFGNTKEARSEVDKTRQTVFEGLFP